MKALSHLFKLKISKLFLKLSPSPPTFNYPTLLTPAPKCISNLPYFPIFPHINYNPGPSLWLILAEISVSLYGIPASLNSTPHVYSSHGVLKQWIKPLSLPSLNPSKASKEKKEKLITVSSRNLHHVPWLPIHVCLVPLSSLPPTFWSSILHSPNTPNALSPLSLYTNCSLSCNAPFSIFKWLASFCHSDLNLNVISSEKSFAQYPVWSSCPDQSTNSNYLNGIISSWYFSCLFIICHLSPN